eukprot:2780994-Prymnesium_polylepis.1
MSPLTSPPPTAPPQPPPPDPTVPRPQRSVPNPQNLTTTGELQQHPANELTATTSMFFLGASLMLPVALLFGLVASVLAWRYAGAAFRAAR